MEPQTNAIILLVAVTALMAVSIWLVVRSIPRMRGKLKAETARLNDSARRSAATLLSGWGKAAAWALGIGIAFYALAQIAVKRWLYARVEADMAPFSAESDEHFQAYLACQKLPSSLPGSDEATVQRCMDSLGPEPVGPLVIDDAWPMLVGWMVPLIAALLTLGILALLVARRRTEQVREPQIRSAHLKPRGLTSFGPRWALAIPGVATLFLFGLLLATGVTSSKDPWGRYTWLVVQRNDTTSGATTQGSLSLSDAEQWVSFPGWFFGVPVLSAAVILLVVAALLLRSLAQAPRPAESKILDIDNLARMLKAKFVAGIAGVGILAALGPMAFFAGASIMTVAGDYRQIEGQSEFYYHDSLYVGVFAVAAGALFCLMAVLMLVLSVVAVIELISARSLAVAVALNEENQDTAPDMR